MSLPRILFSAAAAVLLATSVHAETPAAPPAETGMGGHGGGLRRFLTEDERMMFMVDMRKAVAGMTDDQKQAYREQQRTRFTAMSEADRARFKADLDARWAAIPPDQQAAIRAAVEARMAEHQRPTPQ